MASAPSATLRRGDCAPARGARALATTSQHGLPKAANLGRATGPHLASHCVQRAALSPWGIVPFFSFPFRFQMEFNSNFILGLNLFNSNQTWKFDKLCQVLNSGEESELGFLIQENLVNHLEKYS
jgi:hypothetical protein